MKILKWIGIILGSLVLLAVIAVVVLVLIANSRLNKHLDVTPIAIEIPTDSASIARGHHLASVLCTECHSGAYEGKLFFEDKSIAKIYTPNLTSGKGGIGSTYTDADWVRSIRHGVNPDGKALFIMPAGDFNNMSAHDLGSVIAYIKTVQPIDNEPEENEYHLMGKILLSLGAFGDVISSEVIDHEKGFQDAPPEGVTSEYGGYLVDITGCRTCHHEDLAGGPTGEPGAPPAVNITPGGKSGHWTSEEFIQTIRTGKTPDGRELRDKYMPWPAYARYSDDELGAIYAYLQSIPAVETEE